MIIELPNPLEAKLKERANALGVPVSRYVTKVLERHLAHVLSSDSVGVPFRTGKGMFARYGEAPSSDEIAANRAEMFRNFAE